MKNRGPLVTLAAVAALGVGIVLVNIAQQPDPAPADKPAAQPTASSTPAPAFPARADYIGKVASAGDTITVEITVDGDKAIAYACDGNTVESWLWGSVSNGAVSLAGKDNASRLEGRLEGSAVLGTLSIGDTDWDFTAPAAQPPAGLYIYDQAGVRTTWIVDPDGGVTGVRRREDGSTAPAPELTTDGIAVVDGIEVRAIRVEQASDV